LRVWGLGVEGVDLLELACGAFLLKLELVGKRLQLLLFGRQQQLIALVCSRRYLCQKNPSTVSKETYYSVKRDVFLCIKYLFAPLSRPPPAVSWSPLAHATPATHGNTLATHWQHTVSRSPLAHATPVFIHTHTHISISSCNTCVHTHTHTHTH
jgi:hypothetical protein